MTWYERLNLIAVGLWAFSNMMKLRALEHRFRQLELDLDLGIVGKVNATRDSNGESE